MAFRIALCSEVYKLPLEETIVRVAKLGFDGIEIAPFTVAESVEDVSHERRTTIRNVALDAGIEIIGLHWLLVSPKGLHLTTPDERVRQLTVDYLKALVHFCADLRGRFLVLGSPKQRSVLDGDDPAAAKARAAEGLRKVAEVCDERSVYLFLEPLSPAETNFVNTVEEARDLVAAIAHHRVGYMLDCKAMSAMPGGIVGTIRHHGKSAGHFHANEPSGLAPGMGTTNFAEILGCLNDSGYLGWVSAEPFDYSPDSDTVARAALDALRRASESRNK